MDELFEAYLAVYEENELEKRAKKNKEALDTGFMRMSDEERKKERERIENLAKRESSRMGEEYNNIVLDHLVSEGYADNYDSAASILEAMSDEWLVGILDEKYVKAMDPPKRGKRKGPDHRTTFAWSDPRKIGNNNEDLKMDSEFFRTRLRQNDKKIDPYYEGNRRRRKAKDQARGGFREDYITEAPYQIYGPDPHGSSNSEPRPIGKPYKNKKRAKNRADRLDQEIGGYRHTVHYVEDDK